MAQQGKEDIQMLWQDQNSDFLGKVLKRRLQVPTFGCYHDWKLLSHQFFQYESFTLSDHGFMLLFHTSIVLREDMLKETWWSFHI